MKKTTALLVVAGALLLVPVLSVSAHSYRNDHDYDNHHDYRWSYGYQPYYVGQVTTPYWCGTYYSSWPCTYAYPQYQYVAYPYINYYQPYDWRWNQYHY